MTHITYQQKHLLQKVALANRKQYTYLLEQHESDNAAACVSAGLLEVTDNRIAKLTKAGYAYILWLNRTARA